MNCICCATNFDADEGSCPRCAWNPNAVHNALAGYAVGDVIKKRYVIRESLGKGRLGVAIKAVDKDKNKPVTLKFIHPGLIPDEDAGMRFLTSMNAIRSLGNEQLATPIEAARDQGRYFIAREFLVGVSLKQLMDDQRICGQVFPTDEAVHMIEKFARALVSIRGGAHGAFSPSKIWVLAKDLKIVDYGLAAALPSAAVWHVLKNGPGASFVAPEQQDNRPPDSRGDVFSLGVLLGELLSLAEFNGDVEIFRESEPDLSHEMEALIRCALSSDAEARYDHPMEFVSALYDITGRPRSRTMPPDNTAVVPAAFLNQLRSMSQVPLPPPDDEEMLMAEVTKQVTLDSIGSLGPEVISSTPPAAPITTAVPEPVTAMPAPHSGGFRPPPFRPTDLGPLARSSREISPAASHRVPPPPISGRKSIPPQVPSSQCRAVSKPNEAPVVLKTPPAQSAAPPAPRSTMPPVIPPASQKNTDEISSLRAMLTPKSMPALSLPESQPETQHASEPNFQRTAQALNNKKDTRSLEDSIENIDRYQGINPRFLRAAAKLEKARISQVDAESSKKSEVDEEEWRRQLEETSAGSVISFLPPSTVENPESVEGFPNNQRNIKPQLPMRPVVPRKPPPVPRRK